MRCGWLLLFLFAFAPGLVWASERGVVLVYDAQGGQAKSTTARTALVIGNGSYRRGPLRNPVNDATDIAEALQGLGFEVVLAIDVNEPVFKEGVRKFHERLQRRGGVGLFYYAGHGIQVGGRNYLIPVEADIEKEVDVEYEAVDAGWILGYMDAAKARLNIVILDACRDNPYERSWRSASRGLRRLELPQGPLGSLLAYSTAPGKVAADGPGRNSPFTKHLLLNLEIAGLDLEDVFKRTRIGVSQDTGGRQIPWSESSLLGDFYFQPSTLAGPEPPVVLTQPSKLTPKKAQLTVRSNVYDDTVYIDGQARGPTGLTAHELAPGTHAVRVEKKGYESWERSLKLAAGENKTLRAHLSRSVPEATLPAPDISDIDRHAGRRASETSTTSSPSPTTTPPLGPSPRFKLHDYASLLASACATCHGPGGTGQRDGAPDLTHLTRSSFISRMREFKSGIGPATVMRIIAKGYTDSEIRELASFFAKQ